jgi:hypothetical protein
MTEKTWFGGSGSFCDANDWSPTGVPVAGDTITLTAGTLDVKDRNLSDIPLTMGSFSGATLDLRNSVLGNVVLTSTPALSAETEGNHTIGVSGLSVFAGTVSTASSGYAEFADATTINIDRDSTLLNIGTVSLGADYGETLDVNGSRKAFLLNDGLIDVEGGRGGAKVTIGTNVGGFGTIEVGVAAPLALGYPAGTVEFAGHVGSGQTFEFSGHEGSTTSYVLLQIDMAEAFKATIKDFTSTDTIELKNTTVTSDRFSDGVLTLSDGCHPVAHLHFSGSYTASDFTTQVVDGDTLIKLT